MSNFYALILAGGSGQRFWPLSRDASPKQLLRLLDEKTMLEHTLKRLEGLVPEENVLVLTNAIQLDQVKEVLKGHPKVQIYAEPEKRDTAPAIALAIGWVAARNPEATMMILPSDHWIKDVSAFQETLKLARDTASSQDVVVTVGIEPTWACSSYGYIEKAQQLSEGVSEVRRFREKPNAELAAEFLAQGNFAWNAGMFFWKVDTVRRELQTHVPELANFVNELSLTQSDEAFDQHVKLNFADLPKISIDYALLEKASRVLCVAAKFDWDDLGNWSSVGEYLPQDESYNRSSTEACTIVNSRKNLLYSKTDQHLALLGVENLMVIVTPDAILVADQAQAEKLKGLVDQLPSHLK